MICKLNRSLAVTHKVVEIITLDDKCVTVYDSEKKIDLLDNTATNPYYKFPVEVLHNTKNLLVCRQFNLSKIERLRV